MDTARRQVFEDLLTKDRVASDRTEYADSVRDWLRTVLFGEQS